MNPGLLPLPSLLRASAQDAACLQMRRNNRTAWSAEDYDLAVTTLDRLIAGCWGEGAQGVLRFHVAEDLERAGHLSVSMGHARLLAMVEAAMRPDSPDGECA